MMTFNMNGHEKQEQDEERVETDNSFLNKKMFYIFSNFNSMIIYYFIVYPPGDPKGIPLSTPVTCRKSRLNKVVLRMRPCKQ